MVGKMLESHSGSSRHSSGGSYLLCFFVRSVYRILGRLGRSAKTWGHDGLRWRSVDFAATKGDHRLRRNRAYLHSDLCAAHGVRGEKGGHRPCQRVRHKNYPPCGRAGGKYSEHKDDDRVILGGKML